MSDSLYEIDLAMNMIKEDIIRDLSESVSKQNSQLYLQDSSSSTLPFYENKKD